MGHQQSCWVKFFLMDASQLQGLSGPQLLTLLFTLLCEVARRLRIPITVGAQIGDIDEESGVTHGPDAADSGMAAETTDLHSAGSSTVHPWSVPSPGTPEGPLPEN